MRYIAVNGFFGKGVELDREKETHFRWSEGCS